MPGLCIVRVDGVTMLWETEIWNAVVFSSQGIVRAKSEIEIERDGGSRGCITAFYRAVSVCVCV